MCQLRSRTFRDHGQNTPGKYAISRQLRTQCVERKGGGIRSSKSARMVRGDEMGELMTTSLWLGLGLDRGNGGVGRPRYVPWAPGDTDVPMIDLSVNIP
jgi:hypothetical protein